MAISSRIEVYLKIKEAGIIPLFYHDDPDVCKEIITTCYNSGLKVIEYTNRGDFAHEIFSYLNRYALKKLPDIILGIGSVVDAPTASLYIQLGAGFIVSPLFNPEIARICNRRKILWIPGCGTVSEISAAEEMGAEIIKIFPAQELGGPGFIKSVKLPMPWTTLMPSGGVTPEENNLKSWFDAGAFCVGMGSKLITREIIDNGNYEMLSEKIKEILNTIKKIRK